MMTLRKGCGRGHADHGWLRRFHSFSYSDYCDHQDPAHDGVGDLRVFNEERLAPGTGFGPHGHRDIEIVSVVLDGALAACGDVGDTLLRAGEVQCLSAGSGLRHRETNPDRERCAHYLQIWILPRARGGAPCCEQRHFADADKRGRLALVASPDGRDASLTIHADASIHAGLFDGDERAELALPAGRQAFVHLVRGRLDVNGQALRGGDALTLHGEPALRLAAGDAAEVLVVDVAA